MNARFELQLSKAEYVVGLDALVGELARQDPTRRRVIFERLAVVVLLLLAVSWLFPEAITGLFFLVVSYAVVTALLSNFWTRPAHGVSFDPAIGQQILEFTDDGITESSATRTRQWQWAAVRRVHDREAALIVELVAWDMLVLPSRLWDAPEERQRFLENVRARVSHPAGDPVSATPAPSPMKADLYTLAAIGAFVDACLIGSSFLPVDSRLLEPLANRFGLLGGMLVIFLVSGLLGYLAYRITKIGLPRLHAHSPAAATLVANALIWAFAFWFGATALRLI